MSENNANVPEATPVEAAATAGEAVVQSPPRPVMPAPAAPEDARAQLLSLADEARRRGSRQALHAYLGLRQLLLGKK